MTRFLTAHFSKFLKLLEGQHGEKMAYFTAEQHSAKPYEISVLTLSKLDARSLGPDTKSRYYLVTQVFVLMAIQKKELIPINVLAYRWMKRYVGVPMSLRLNRRFQKFLQL